MRSDGSQRPTACTLAVVLIVFVGERSVWGQTSVSRSSGEAAQVATSPRDGGAALETEPACPREAPSYPHQAFRKFEIGTGPRSYWIFEPDKPQPARAPVVVLLHGWQAYNPAAYGAWILHLTRSGRIVVFPRYQDVSTRPAAFLTNAGHAVRDSLVVLASSSKHVRPDLTRVVFLGHSAGGNIAVQLAATAHQEGVPSPVAVIALMPGEVSAERGPDLATIPPQTLLVVTVGEDDYIVGDHRARQIFAQTTSIPAARKKFILYRSDLHGRPWLIADHLAPTAAARDFDTAEAPFRGIQMRQARLDALDRAALWRMADITFEAAFHGQTLDDAADRGALFLNLGRWSDGRPVTPPIVADNPDDVPRIIPPNGLRLLPIPSLTASPAPETSLHD